MLATSMAWGGYQNQKGKEQKGKGSGGSIGNGKGWSVTNPGGQGKGAGKMYGKGEAAWPSWPTTQDQAWGEEAPGTQDGTERTNRIWARYQFPKIILRATAGKGGSCFVKDMQRMADDKFLSEDNLKRIITADNSHVLRRPGVGLSETAASIQAGVDVLYNMKDVGFDKLANLVESAGDPFTKALAEINSETANEPSPESLGAAWEVLKTFLDENTEEMWDYVRNITIATGRLYVMGTALLQIMPAVKDPAWWAENIPAVLSEHKAFIAWKAKATDAAKMKSAMTALMTEKLEKQADPLTTNAAASLFKTTTRKIAEVETEEEDATVEPSKKKLKKVEKQRAKEAAKKKKKSSESSGSGAETEDSSADRKKARKAKKRSTKEASNKKKKKKDSESESDEVEDEASSDDRASKKKKKKQQNNARRQATELATKAAATELKLPQEAPGDSMEAKASSAAFAEVTQEAKDFAKTSNETVEKRESRDVAFVTWSPEDVQSFVAAAEQLKADFESTPESMVATCALTKLTDRVPTEVMQANGELQTRIAKASSEEGIENADAQGIVRAVLSLGLAAQEFYETQASLAAEE